MQVEAARARWMVAFELASLAGFVVLFVWLAAGYGLLLRDAPLAFASGMLAGALLADLSSGVVHWLCDRFGSEATPLFGPLLIAGFREHHRDPGSIARHGLVERSGANAATGVVALLLGAVLLRGPGGGGAAGAFVLGAALATALLAALTNEIHLQAHRADAPRFVRVLQRLRLVLRPAEHARHHGGRHDRAYCIATGWCNPLLDGLGIFARLERRLGRGA